MRLNRAGRRMDAALTRKKKSLDARDNAIAQAKQRREERAKGLKKRLDKVRARTKVRKGKTNNPRFN